MKRKAPHQTVTFKPPNNHGWSWRWPHQQGLTRDLLPTSLGNLAVQRRSGGGGLLNVTKWIHNNIPHKSADILFRNKFVIWCSISLWANTNQHCYFIVTDIGIWFVGPQGEVALIETLQTIMCRWRSQTLEKCHSSLALHWNQQEHT